MSGSTRGSRSRNLIFTSTVALARSTVGTMRDDAAEAHVGKGVELDLGGLADLDLAERGLGHVGLDLERVHVGHGHHRALGVDRAEEKGVMMSPTLAFLVSTTPSNGARMSVCSTATSAAR